MFLRKTRTTYPLNNALVRRRKERINLRNSSPIRSRLAPIFALLLVSILVSVMMYVLFTQLSVQHIYCTDSDHASCPPELLQELEQFQDKPLLFLHITQPDDFIHDFQQYDTLTWSKHYPNSLQFTVQKSPPVYSIVTDQRKFLVLKSGKVTEIDQTPQQLMTIQFSSPPNTDDHQILEAEVHNTLQTLLELAKQSQLQIFQISWFDTHTIQIELQNGKKLIVKSEDLPDQFQKIQSIMQKEIDIGDWKELDVRFQHPVVR